MRHQYCCQFLGYRQLADFSTRSLEALTVRLNELANFLKIRNIRAVKKIRYRHLIDYAADYNEPSIHITKSRVWALRQFYHFLTLHRIVSENIASAGSSSDAFLHCKRGSSWCGFQTR
jgi:integrase/recombinase XerC